MFILITIVSGGYSSDIPAENGAIAGIDTPTAHSWVNHGQTQGIHICTLSSLNILTNYPVLISQA